MKDYTRKNPCNDCPYRKDAPLMKWSIEEFKDLIQKDNDYFGSIYGCHKKDGHICVGWLADQDNRNFPSIALRMSLSKNNINRVYLDSIHGKEMYSSIQEMSTANYPEINF